MAKINQTNSKGQEHGYWKYSNSFGHIEKDSQCINGHYINDSRYGYWDVGRFKCHYKNEKEIGVEMFLNKRQYFYKQGNCFGEELIWKKLKK